MNSSHHEAPEPAPQRAGHPVRRAADDAAWRALESLVREEWSAALEGEDELAVDEEDEADLGLLDGEPAAGLDVAGCTLVRPLGRGGMGEVWEARQERPKRRVAIKLIAQAWRPSARTLLRFAREADAMARVSHPGVVRVLAAGESQGLHWMVQELVEDGRSLRDALCERERAGARDARAHWRWAVELVARVADAMQAVHDAGVLHRDLKPENILLSADDEPRVADFGLARLEGEPRLSSQGESPGTAGYLSPEALRGDALDERSDVFSLACVLVEALCLRPAFEGATAPLRNARACMGAPADLSRRAPALPAALVGVCERALDPDPRRRPGSMRSFASALRQAAAGPRRVRRRAQRTRSTWALAWAAALLALLGLGWRMSALRLELELLRQQLEAPTDMLAEAWRAPRVDGTDLRTETP